MTTRQEKQNTVRQSLVESMTEQLRHVITTGNFKVGEKLPSEAKLGEQYNVSRTVVRESIATLRNEGLVEVRRGSGIYIVDVKRQKKFYLQLGHPENLASTLEILELRTAIEVEAAGLAALRRSPAQEEIIYQKLAVFDQAVDAGQETGKEDFDFHIAIAEATNNPQFKQFLIMLGAQSIPRSRLSTKYSQSQLKKYMQQLQLEHRQIADAISLQKKETAREAMRVHLQGGQERYRVLLRG